MTDKNTALQHGPVDLTWPTPSAVSPQGAESESETSPRLENNYSVSIIIIHSSPAGRAHKYNARMNVFASGSLKYGKVHASRKLVYR